MAEPPELPPDEHWTVVYDGACGICKWLLAGFLRLDRERRLRPIPLQSPEADALLADLEPSERMASWHLLSADGVRVSAGAALPRLLSALPGGGLPAATLARFPRLTASGYRWVAEHRSQLSRFVPQRAKQRAAERIRGRERSAFARRQT
jgi:predicted DCC family thiol-disulfide oxidoreductase YuxK